MAATCLHCDKKIGLFKKPIEGLYCSYDCRNEARNRLEQLQQRAHVERVERERAEALAVEQRMHSEVVARAEARSRSMCPKCGAGWAHEHGAGSMGLDRGSCTTCGFSAEFLAIERCPHCRCQSFVVMTADEARCPRCKTRTRRSA